MKARLEMARMENLAEQAVPQEAAEASWLIPFRAEIARLCLNFRNPMALEEHYLFPHLRNHLRLET